jgi:hypothetical protein
MVEIHHVFIRLVWLDAVGKVVLKDNATSMEAMKRAVTQEHRIEPYTSGPCSSANSENPVDPDKWLTLREYLAAEAADTFAVAYVDQYQVITQMIT